MSSKTVDTATTATPDEALKCLFLVGERLTNVAFHTIADDVGKELATKVEKLASHHIREALVMPERVVSRGDVASMPYFQGIVRGIARCAKESPSDLICLREFNETAPHLISAALTIASGFLRSLRLAGDTSRGREASRLRGGPTSGTHFGRLVHDRGCFDLGVEIIKKSLLQLAPVTQTGAS